jgi:hypothetical protein
VTAAEYKLILYTPLGRNTDEVKDALQERGFPLASYQFVLKVPKDFPSDRMCSSKKLLHWKVLYRFENIELNQPQVAACKVVECFIFYNKLNCFQNTGSRFVRTRCVIRLNDARNL